MFFGFKNEELMRLACPRITEDMIKSAIVTTKSVCTRYDNKECWGSLFDDEGNKYYIYSDQTRDRGILIKTYRLKVGNYEYAW